MTLLVHRGGWEASKADLACVPLPEATVSYHPVPYHRFIEEIELHIPRFGLEVCSSQFALAREGDQKFGVLTCSNGTPDKGYALRIGLRNSCDRSLFVELVAGTRVFCCDNLAFSGEVRMQRKHTLHVFRDLPHLIHRMLSQVSSIKVRIEAEIEAMKELELRPANVHITL